jgi:hypothetical protein
LIAKAGTKLAVNVDCFGQVVLRSKGLHEIPVPALSQGGKADELPASPDGTWQFGPSDSKFGRRITLQRAESKNRQLVADLIDPRGILAR